MKPIVIAHDVYRSTLLNCMNSYYPDRTKIPEKFNIIYRKFLDLDLSGVDILMQAHYSRFGPRPWSPSVLLRSLLVMIMSKCTSITSWVDQLRVTPILAVICGFEPDKIPGVGTFYDFLTRLWDLPSENFSDHIKPHYKNRLRKPKVKGAKADSVEKETVEQLIERLSHAELRIDDEAYATLYKIFRTCFLDRSIHLGMVHPDTLRLAGDGTPVVTAARFRSRHTCDCASKGIKNCTCDRYYPQPDCNIGWDSSRESWYFGYDMYLLTDPEHDLPVFVTLNPASKHDSHSFCEAFFRHTNYSPDLMPGQLLLDSAHDSMAMYHFCKSRNIQPFIDLNLGNSKKGSDYHGVTLAPDGIPVCAAGLKMNSNGTDLNRQYAKFICPRMSKGKCACDSPCSTAKYGRTCSVPLKTNIRLYNSPPRGSHEWKTAYNARTSVERSNKRMKNDYLLELGHHRSTKLWYIRAYLIMMLLHLDSWSIPGES